MFLNNNTLTVMCWNDQYVLISVVLSPAYTVQHCCAQHVACNSVAQCMLRKTVTSNTLQHVARCCTE